MPNQWFRFYHEFATDPKVQIMPEHMQRRLVMLFCFRCQSDGPVTFCDEHMAFHWHVTAEELAETKAVFIRNGFIDDTWNLLNWNKRQYISDSSTDRTRAYRERMRTSREQQQNVTVTAPDTDTDTEQIQKTEKRTKPQAAVIPEWIPKEPWEAFVEMRKDSRHPLKGKAITLAIGELEKLRAQGQDVAAVLNQSTMKSYRGLFAVSNGNGSLPFGQNQPRKVQSSEPRR